MILSQKKHTVNNPQALAKMLEAVLQTEDEISREREHFWVVGLNTRNVVQYLELAFIGTLDSCAVHPREVFRLAVAKGVQSILLAHNHPSGDVDPSTQDIDLTAKLSKCGEILGIPVYDHVIISGQSNGAYFSMAENRLM